MWFMFTSRCGQACTTYDIRVLITCIFELSHGITHIGNFVMITIVL